MIEWKNLDELASWNKIAEAEPVDLTAAMSGKTDLKE